MTKGEKLLEEFNELQCIYNKYKKKTAYHESEIEGIRRQIYKVRHLKYGIAGEMNERILAIEKYNKNKRKRAGKVVVK